MVGEGVAFSGMTETLVRNFDLRPASCSGIVQASSGFVTV